MLFSNAEFIKMLMGENWDGVFINETADQEKVEISLNEFYELKKQIEREGTAHVPSIKLEDRPGLRKRVSYTVLETKSMMLDSLG